MWPTIANVLGTRGDCYYYVTAYDYNNDSKVSYRETIPVGYEIWASSDNVESKKQQINCSACSGMDVYNV